MQTNQLDQHFEFPDALPDSLYQRVVTLRHGNLQHRVEGILQWRINSLAAYSSDIPAIACFPKPAKAK